MADQHYDQGKEGEALGVRAVLASRSPKTRWQ
ncbi:MAG: hypothetical protein ACJAUC_004393 [Planctomycetota bacterium]